MKQGWRQNFRANLVLWPSPTPNIRDISQLDGQRYDERAFLASLGGGSAKKRPTDSRAVRQTIEALALSGLAFRTDPADVFALTDLGREIFTSLAGQGAPRQRIRLGALMATALVEVAEYRAILQLVLEAGNFLSNDELNRAMPHIRSLDDVAGAADRILDARVEDNTAIIGPREYTGAAQRKAINPWFRLAGGGGLLITVDRTDTYRRIEPELVPWVKAAIGRASKVPLYLSDIDRPSRGTTLVGPLSTAAMQSPLTTLGVGKQEVGRKRPPTIVELSGGARPRPTIDPLDVPLDDPDELQQYARRIRRGQAKFRNHLLRLYDHCCAITGHGPGAVLQAAHIMPHSETGRNHPENGILLRADVHDLLDDGLIFIEPESLVIHVDASLRDTPYWTYDGTTLRARTDSSRPSLKYLQTQWLKKSR